MPINCWCYTVSSSYLLPALVSALQLHSHIKNIKDRIIVIVVGNESNLYAETQLLMRSRGVEVVIVSPAIMMDYPLYCARLLLDRMIDTSQFEFITYIDADTQFVRSVTALSEAVPPSGSIIAVPDIMSIIIDHPSKYFKNHKLYFTQIGIPEQHQSIYFNTGVMKFRTGDWSLISKECLIFLNKNRQLGLRYPDQDALNIVMGGRQTLASFKWNFPAFFIGSGIEDVVEPNILHFMSRPRPWDGPFLPWGKAAYQPYERFVEDFPQFKHLFVPSRNIKKLRYVFQQLYKVTTEPWRSNFIRKRVSNFEERALL
jgi:lipopolysaccharide biosynthesis glycosyltransferase